MFNETFSLVPGTSHTISAGAKISPYTSQLCSPHQTELPSEARLTRSYGDTAYDTYRSRHQSITALTAQLESHALSVQRRPSYTSDYQDEPSRFDLPSADRDEGYCEGPDTAIATFPDSGDFYPAHYSLGISDLCAISSPSPSLSLQAQVYSADGTQRRQRQALIRLQYLAKGTSDLAMRVEECHPSSLAMPSDFTPRSGSMCVITNGRIEKDRRRSYAAVRKLPKMRKERR